MCYLLFHKSVCQFKNEDFTLCLELLLKLFMSSSKNIPSIYVRSQTEYALNLRRLLGLEMMKSGVRHFNVSKKKDLKSEVQKILALQNRIELNLLRYIVY